MCLARPFVIDLDRRELLFFPTSDGVYTEFHASSEADALRAARLFLEARFGPAEAPFGAAPSDNSNYVIKPIAG